MSRQGFGGNFLSSTSRHFVALSGQYSWLWDLEEKRKRIWSTKGRAKTMLFSRMHKLINILAMVDAEDVNIVALYFENDPIVTYSDLPVSLKSPSQGLTIFMGSNHKAAFYCFFDPTPYIRIDLGKIFCFDLGMVRDLKGHELQISSCDKALPGSKLFSLSSAMAAKA